MLTRPNLIRAGSGWKVGELLSWNEALAKAGTIIEDKRIAAIAKLKKKQGGMVSSDDEDFDCEEGKVIGPSTRGSRSFVMDNAIKNAKAKKQPKASAKPKPGRLSTTPARAKRSSQWSPDDQAEDEQLSEDSQDGVGSGNESDCSVGTCVSGMSRISTATSKQSKVAGSERSAPVKKQMKHDIVLDKWLEKMAPRKFMVKGNLGRTINQATFILDIK
jgi:hypothetical protein